MSRTQLTSTVYAPVLRAEFTRYVQDLQSTLYARIIYAPDLRVQSTPSNYVYNLRAQLTRTIYVLVWRARFIHLSLARTCYALILRVQSMRSTYAIRHVKRLNFVRTYYTL